MALVGGGTFEPLVESTLWAAFSWHALTYCLIWTARGKVHTIGYQSYKHISIMPKPLNSHKLVNM